jgi:NAD-dependent dihydropyrimidine dehydrogenase PreA subunit
MVKDFSKTSWHGVPRQEIPWYPKVNADACIGCELCYVTCGRDVYEIVLNESNRKKAIVERPNNCMVACSTCAMVCPTEAIAFPSRDIVWNIEREHKVLKTVRAEAKEKHEKIDIMADRHKVEQELSKITSRVPVRIAGSFGEKSFLVKLEKLISDRPYDIVNLTLNVPTIKGLLEHTPAYMDFEVTSITQEDITSFVNELRKLVIENELVWVEK